MNKSESKYFNTAVKMDEAFLELLQKKDFEFITVKEICEKAGVNRSTFYLHYETLADILSESVQHINEQFSNYMKRDSGEFVSKIENCSLNELFLVTPEYLTPYLSYVTEHKRLFRTMVNNAGSLHLDETYEKMFQYIFTPILERFHIPQNERKYIITFYISGLIGIITDWLKANCADSVTDIIAVMQKCVKTINSEKCTE